MAGLILPAQSAPAAGWALRDIITTRFTSAPHTGTGPLQIEGPQLADDEMWLIDHAVVWCDSTASTQVRWFESEAVPQFLIDGTDDGNFNVADWPTGLLISPSRSLLMQWSGASPGAIAGASLQLRVMQR